eukprot:g17217.t1
MEGVINIAIKQHRLSNNLLGDALFGFRQGHSAPDLITILVQTWTKELNFRDESSQFQDIPAGVLQGNVLGPAIFSYFINDFPSIKRPEAGMFANDCTIFSTICNSTDTEAVCVQMQQDLDNIQAWADKWQ